MSKTIQVDTKTFIRFWLVIAGLIILIMMLVQAKVGLLIVGAALFLAVALTPLMRKISRINKGRAHPGVAAGVTVGGLVVALGLVVAVAAPVVVSETSKFVSQAPEQIQSAMSNSDWIDQIGDNFGIENLRGQIVSAVKNAFGGILDALPKTLFDGVGAVGSFLAAVILTVVLTILFLTQGPDLLNRTLDKLGKRDSKKMVVTRRILSRVTGVISGYVTGQVLVAILDGVVTTIAVLILSLIFNFSSGLAVPMGLIAMIFYMIPMFGPIITCALVSVILLCSNPWAALAFVVFYALYEQIEGNIISPRVQSGRLDLPPLVILVAVTLGMYMFGLVGAIVSIPVAGIIRVLIDEYMTWKEASEEA